MLCAIGVRRLLKAEQKSLEERHGSGFKVAMSRQDAWRVRFEVLPYTSGESRFTQWDEEDIPTWVRSIAFQNGLEPGTVRKVCARINRGTQLAVLTQQVLESPNDWNLRPRQALALLTAIDTLKEADSKNWGPSKNGPFAVAVRSPTSLHLDLNAYWPKLLEPGRSTARSSRYPFEAPLLALSGWNKIEDQSGIQISTESKLRALKALGQQAIMQITGVLGTNRSPSTDMHLQRLVDWMSKRLLELVPELQQALFIPAPVGAEAAMVVQPTPPQAPQAPPAEPKNAAVTTPMPLFDSFGRRNKAAATTTAPKKVPVDVAASGPKKGPTVNPAPPTSKQKQPKAVPAVAKAGNGADAPAGFWATDSTSGRENTVCTLLAPES